MTTRMPTGLFLLAVLLGVLAACGVNQDDGFRAINPEDIGLGLQETTSSTTPSTTPPSPSTTFPTTTTTLPTDPVTLYFVLGRGLLPVTRPVLRPVRPITALDALQAGPLEEDRPVGLRTSIPADSLAGIQVAGGVATVDLSRDILSIQPTSEQVLAFAQIVATLTARPGIGRVAFTVEGTVVDPPRADGSVAEDSVSCDDYVSLLPPNTCPGPAPTTTTTSASTEPTTAAPPPDTSAP